MAGRKTKATKEYNVRLTEEEYKRVCYVAYNLGLTRANKGSASRLLKAIANGTHQVWGRPD